MGIVQEGGEYPTRRSSHPGVGYRRAASSASAAAGAVLSAYTTSASRPKKRTYIILGLHALDDKSDYVCNRPRTKSSKAKKTGEVCWQSLQQTPVFTALHGMQTRSSDENSVCLSVRLSGKRVICDKTKESCARIFIPHERPFILFLWRMVGGGDPFDLKFWVNRPAPLERNRRFWTDIRS